MILFFVSFLAGILTVLAPCVLPLLPVIIGGSASGTHKRNPYVITAALTVAIVLFTLLLKFSTAFINIPSAVWSTISGVVLVAFGITSVFPGLWERLNNALGLSTRSDVMLNQSARKNSWWGDILIGLSLGPVFSSCSPTYFLILATVLPQSFAQGLLDLIAYALGLSLVLLLISLLGQRFVKGAKWAADPQGYFKRGLGLLFVLVGVFIITGLDKQVQTYLVEKEIFSSTSLEQALLQKVTPKSRTDTGTLPTTNEMNNSNNEPVTMSNDSFPRYREIDKPAGYVNSEPFTIGQFVGKKVILVDFMTYSCINCIRTFPYLNAWYDKYKDQGLEIVGVHTPEFAFEHKLENVEKALAGFGIKFPVVLDNDYGTWSAYGNSYWPRKYLIDIDGRIVYDHIGEGKYDETERKIQELLKQKMARAKQTAADLPWEIARPYGVDTSINSLSPEIYFGSDRNEYLANGEAGSRGWQTFVLPVGAEFNRLYLGGTWNIAPEYAQAMSAQSAMMYRYGAQDVYMVASAPEEIKVAVTRDGKPLSPESAGSDIIFENGQSYCLIKAERLYNIISDNGPVAEHTLRLHSTIPGLKVYTFTFG